MVGQSLDPSDVSMYSVYWSAAPPNPPEPKLGLVWFGRIKACAGRDATLAVLPGTPIDPNGRFLVAFSENANGESEGFAYAFVPDYTHPGAATRPDLLIFRDSDGDSGKIAGVITIRHAWGEDIDPPRTNPGNSDSSENPSDVVVRWRVQLGSAAEPKLVDIGTKDVDEEGVTVRELSSSSPTQHQNELNKNNTNINSDEVLVRFIIRNGLNSDGLSQILAEGLNSEGKAVEVRTLALANKVGTLTSLDSRM